MPHGLFVAGTDTGVGKTVVAAAVIHRLRRYVPVCYWKPIQTGIEQDDDTAEVKRLTAAQAEEIFDCGIRLPRPVSPHLAAQSHGISISVDRLVDSYRRNAGSRYWIVEGAGGLLVPVNDQEFIADLMIRLRLPAVVVARTALGTINHTLLTLEALRRRAVEVVGVVMVGRTDEGARAAIARYGKVEILGELPFLGRVTSEALAAWSSELDPANRLIDQLSWT